MTGWLPDEAEALFGAGAVAAQAYDLLTVDVPAESWLDSLRTARDTLGCTYFDWLSAVDEPGAGFQVCAHLVRLDGGVRRLLVRTTVPHEAPALPTATGVFAGAGWHERETHEMFGVDFTGHPHMAPLLLPEEFEGHPLRKDFVLAARVVKAWPGAKEPGESHEGGPKRRQMQPPGVPDPNEWGPLKGQLPPAPARPARTPRAAGRAAGAGTGTGTPGAAAPSGERPARRIRSASEGSAGQAAGADAPTPPAPPRERTPDAPWEKASPPERPAGREPSTEPSTEPPARPRTGEPASPGPAAEPPSEAEAPAGPAEEPPSEGPAPTERAAEPPAGPAPATAAPAEPPVPPAEPPAADETEGGDDR